MPLNNVTYPVTSENGVVSNTFPANKPLYLTARRIDQNVSAYTSGLDGKLEIETSQGMTGVELGDYVTFGGLSYTTQSARVIATNGTDPTVITVDANFISTDITNAFVNYHKNYFLQVRYVRFDSGSNDQNALEIISDYTQTNNDIEGDITANISLPAELLEPDFDIESEVVPGLSIQYKIQYRESYDGARSLDWTSPSPDFKLLLVHGVNLTSTNDFTDLDITKRFIRNYPLMYSFVYSDINDPGDQNLLRITAIEYDITKTEITRNVVFSDVNVNGVVIIKIDPEDIDVNTRFINFEYVVTASNGQYDSNDYEPDDYQTELEGLGFPYGFPIKLS